MEITSDAEMFSNLTYQQVRSLGIFIAYNTTCTLVALRCIAIITNEWRKSHGRPSSSARASIQHRMRLFGVFAVLSVASTWYYMIAFYFRSYRDWDESQRQDFLPQAAIGKMASWLEGTRLFEQAWAAVVETEPRLWWSSQIFSFCAGWSVLLGIEGE